MTVRTLHGLVMCTAAALCISFFVAQAAGAASDGSRPAKPSDIRVDSNLVLIPVSVTDSKDHPVVGLDPHRFRVFEGKDEQQVVAVSNEDLPVSVGIVFDGSASMTSKLSKAREAVVEFLKSANPEDEFFLVNFSNTAEVAVPFTTSGAEIQNRLMYATNKGRTALLDAVYLALQTMKDARNSRKAILIISDGGDNQSRYTETEVRRLTQEAGVWIYAIGVYSNVPVILPEEERGGPELLSKLARETGGRHFAVEKTADLPAAAAKISLELRNQYVLGYRPSNLSHDGRFHQVQVRVVDSRNLQLSWRPGYYAPLP